MQQQSCPTFRLNTSHDHAMGRLGSFLHTIRRTGHRLGSKCSFSLATFRALLVRLGWAKKLPLASCKHCWMLRKGLLSFTFENSSMTA
eukprot:1836339-Rhodomonas_salina.1